MFSLLSAVLALSGVIALFVALPGFLATGPRALRPPLLHCLLVGTGMHFAVLATASVVTRHVAPAAVLVAVLPLVVGGALWAKRRRQGGLATAPGWEPPELDRRSALLVTGVVLLAAVLRWLHNYHFDDLQHLRYLTEVLRQDTLFPPEFVLQLAHVRVLGEGDVMLSRYPYWGASIAVLARLSHVVPGDAYYLLGLALLWLVLAQMAALAGRAWGSAAGALWALAVVAVSPFTNDSLLNFGGYPFQCGKLLILLGGTAMFTAWRTRRPYDLVVAAVGLSVGPLLHTNNIIGAVTCLAVLPLFLLRPTLRRPVAWVAVSMGAVAVLAAGSLLTDGFVQWRPAPGVVVGTGDAEQDSARTSRPGAGALSAGEVAARMDPVTRRLQLFIDRGVPDELLALVAFLILLPVLLKVRWIAALAVPVAFTAAGVLILVIDFAPAVARQLITNAAKPGYLTMRPALMALRPKVPAGPVVTDAITNIFARAAGWPIPGPPPQDLFEQLPLLLVQHPDVTGEGLGAVLAGLGPSSLVVNEQVVGAGVTRKFTGARGLQVRARWGSSTPAETELAAKATALIEDAYALDSPAVASGLPQAAAMFWHVIGSRPTTLMVYSGAAAPLRPDTLGALLRTNSDAAATGVRPFVNSAFVTVDGPGACASRMQLMLSTESSFGDTVTMWTLDPVLVRGAIQPTRVPGTLGVDFAEPVCGGRRLTFFVHGGPWWDFRFRVEAVEWRPWNVGAFGESGSPGR